MATPDKTRDPAKWVFLTTLTLSVLAVTFLAGLYLAHSRHPLYRSFIGFTKKVSLVFEERENLVPDGEPIHFLQPARKPGDGVTVNSLPDDGATILIAGFFDGGNAARLMRRDGTLLAEWPLRFSEHFPDPAHLRFAPATDRNIDTHGSLALPDGSLVFNWEYGGSVKLSRCGDVTWTVPEITHHSIEQAETGGYWVPGRAYLGTDTADLYPPVTRLQKKVAYPEDLILRLDSDGKVIERKSVPEILWDNELQGVMTAGGFSFDPRNDWEDELVHVNKITELSTELAPAFPMFEAGDLMLSLRTHNLVFVVDPDDWHVKWHQTGPWLRQHDPEFSADGTITVFNNNRFLTDLGPLDRSLPDTPMVSNILRIDPETRATSIAAGMAPGQAFLSVIRGKHDPVPGGGFIITEFEGGRAFQTDAEGRVVWEYLNRYDETQVAELTEARLYPADYFTVTDWSCPPR
ncbi:arylsulfotransferase family protein [Fluviibacterium sp. S390]|uniref:arylsulfotransferase family protein n=1 Tax=Fluviibacterium sp. S390 TaxID=3415139 RepID=UPI003C7A76CC